jgi:hypothetical protein
MQMKFPSIMGQPAQTYQQQMQMQMNLGNGGNPITQQQLQA